MEMTSHFLSPAALYQGKTIGTRWIRETVGPTAGMNIMVRENLHMSRKSTLNSNLHNKAKFTRYQPACGKQRNSKAFSPPWAECKKLKFRL
jgi:hypothetical protein